MLLRPKHWQSWGTKLLPLDTPHHLCRDRSLSTDGSRLMALFAQPDQSYGFIHGLAVSDNSGANWAVRLPADSPLGVAASRDGSLVVASNVRGEVLLSSDAGATWTTVYAPLFATSVTAMTASSDGRRLLAIATVSGSYSLAGGTVQPDNTRITWRELQAAGRQPWQALASSTDGLRLVAAAKGGTVYISTDGGNSWASSAGAGSGDWSSLACDASCTRIAAVSTSPTALVISDDGGGKWTVRSYVTP